LPKTCWKSSHIMSLGPPLPSSLPSSLTTAAALQKDFPSEKGTFPTDHIVHVVHYVTLYCSIYPPHEHTGPSLCGESGTALGGRNCPGVPLIQISLWICDLTRDESQVTAFCIIPSIWRTRTVKISCCTGVLEGSSTLG